MGKTIRLLLGYDDKGVAIEIPLTHTVLSAITGGGKTEGLKQLIHEAVRNGLTVLAIDVKSKPRDFEGLGPATRPFIIESTEPLLVLRMLESIAGASLFRHFNVLLDACIDTESLEDVRRELEGIRDNKKASSFKREGAKTLAYLMERLRSQIDKGHYAEDLELVPGKVNVMDISTLPEGPQQLVVDSVFRRLLETDRRDVVVALEEAINFIPQAEQQQFETSARRFVREGRSANLFLWLSGQALTELDVHVRKQMRVWILGPQAEENEAEKFRRQVPMKGITAADIMNLPTGWFVCAIRTEDAVTVHKVYAKPFWLDPDKAVQVARGGRKVSWTRQFKSQRTVSDTDEEERREYEHTIEALRADLKEAKEYATEFKRKWDELRAEADHWKKEIPKRVEAAVALGDLKEAVRSAPSSRAVQVGPLAIEAIEREAIVTYSREPIEYSTATVKGKIVFTLLEELNNAPSTESEIADAMRERGWNYPHNTMAPELAKLVKNGELMNDGNKPARYRLPGKVEIRRITA